MTTNVRDGYRDPGEMDWQGYFMAALASGVDVPKAKETADKAYALHCERWPRERKVIPLTEHVEALETERIAGASTVIRAIGEAAASAYSDLKYQARGGKRPRADAAEVLSSFASAAATLIAPVMGKLVIGNRLQWQAPPEADDSESYVFNERATKMVERLLILSKRVLLGEKPFEDESWMPGIREASEELWRAVNRSKER